MESADERRARELLMRQKIRSDTCDPDEEAIAAILEAIRGEREACANVAEIEEQRHSPWEGRAQAARKIAEAIRARSAEGSGNG